MTPKRVKGCGQAMTDNVKKVIARLRRTARGVPHLETLLAHIDGEPARLAAACEEVREACARFCAEEYYYVPQSECAFADSLEAIRATPLDATPLADELRDEREVSQSLREQLIAAEAERDALRARVAELERTLRINSLAHIETGKLREKAEAERDELLERHAEFERKLSELDSAKRALQHVTAERDEAIERLNTPVCRCRNEYETCDVCTGRT